MPSPATTTTYSGSQQLGLYNNKYTQEQRKSFFVLSFGGEILISLSLPTLLKERFMAVQTIHPC